MTITVTSLPLNNNATKLGLVGLLTGSDSAATPITRNLSLIAEARDSVTRHDRRQPVPDVEPHRHDVRWSLANGPARHPGAVSELQGLSRYIPEGGPEVPRARERHIGLCDLRGRAAEPGFV